ncbi:MAG: hypothetical protein AAF711_06460 [Planctomycetota bacterium]
MVSAKATVQKVLDNLPDDCTIQDVMDRLFVANLIEERLDELDNLKADSCSTDQVREMISKWRSK